jgi:hypothetical protein
MVDSHPSLIMTLIVGLLVAFALQLLLANLGIAAGITLVGSFSGVDADESNYQQPEASNSGHSIRFVLGFATLASVNLALFMACFLAVKLSLVTDALTGAVLGVVIWSAYLLLLVWLGSSTIGFLLGSVGEVIGFGWQGLRSIGQFILGRKPEAIESRLQQQITTELAMIRKTQQALNSANLDTLQTVLQPASASRQPAQPLSPDLKADILNFLKSAHSQELTLEEIDQRLQRLESHNDSDHANSWMSDMKPLLQAIRSRIDLSELDAERVIDYIRSFPDRVGETVEKISSFVLPTTTVQSDVEDFLLNADLTKLGRKTVKSEFTSVIYDVEADPYLVQQQLSQLTAGRLTEILQQREDLPAKKITKIVDRLEAVRQDVLEIVNRTIAQTRFQQANQPIVDYLRTATLTELKPKRIQKQLKHSLEQSKTAITEWTEQLQYLDRDFFSQPLMERDDLDQTTIKELLEQLEGSRDRLLTEVQDLQTQVQIQAENLWQKWLEYLSNSSEKLNTRNLKRQLKTLLKTAKVAPSLLQPYLPADNRVELEQWLTKRGDLTAKQVQQVCDRIEQVWQSGFEPVEQSPITTTSMVEQVTQALTSYLHQTLQQSERAIFDSSTLQQDLPKLLKSLSLPVGVSSLLTTIDWQQVIKQLIEQNSLPATDATALSNILQQAIYTISKPPRRWAVRAQAAIQDTTVDSMLKLGSELPEAIIQPVVQQFDETRSQLIQQVEHLQQQTQQRVETLKSQAQQQMAMARKTAAIAAWWLFSTALTSLITSAIAGFLAVAQLTPTLVH